MQPRSSHLVGAIFAAAVAVAIVQRDVRAAHSCDELAAETLSEFLCMCVVPLDRIVAPQHERCRAAIILHCLPAVCWTRAAFLRDLNAGANTSATPDDASAARFRVSQ